jgi:ribosomal protein S18 acetylase RimI-like enzyme
MKGEIVEAKKKDDIRILELLNSDSNLYASEEDRAKTLDVKQYLQGGTHKVFLYKVDGNTVGLIIAQFFTISKWVYLNYIAVDKNYQGQGIAKSLMNFLETLAKKGNFELIELFTRRNNKKMIEFMKKLNYSEGDRLRFFYKKL